MATKADAGIGLGRPFAKTIGALVAMSAIGPKRHAPVHCICTFSGLKRTWLSHRKMSANDPKRTSRAGPPSSRKRFSYFLLGRLRFGDDVVSRRFAHLVSDGLPLT
jgi:hypothetical protein